MDNIKFETQFEIDKKIIKSENNLREKRSGKLHIYIVWFCITWFTIISVLTIFASFIFRTADLIIAAKSSSIVVIFFLFLLFIYPSIKLKRVSKMLDSDKLVRTIRFGENIEISTGNSSATYSYDKVRFIEENDENFYFTIWSGQKMIFGMKKDSFTVGNSDEFLEFLKAKSSENEPLWSKSMLNKSILKDSFVIILLLVIFAIIIPTWSFFKVMPDFIEPQAVFESGINIDSEIELITYVEITDGAVAFGKDDEDRIFVAVMDKTLNLYILHHHHYRYIIKTADYNAYYSDPVFESEEDELLLKDNETTVVYGVAYASWWEEVVDEIHKVKYSVHPFEYGGLDFVLYYREV